jgi:hypothetical protein
MGGGGELITTQGPFLTLSLNECIVLLTLSLTAVEMPLLPMVSFLKSSHSAICVGSNLNEINMIVMIWIIR